MTARNWCFTSFKVDEPSIEENVDKIKYGVYQREVAPETGKEHWQGFVSMRSPVRMTGIKAVIGDPAAHVEVVKGTPEQNIAYCTKDESRKEGTQPREFGCRQVFGQGKSEYKSGG